MPAPRSARHSASTGLGVRIVPMMGNWSPLYWQDPDNPEMRIYRIYDGIRETSALITRVYM